jgi:alcohol dehydrogenase/propanol-preferring alcohol dehydrogenase
MKTYQVVENGKPLIENELERPTPTGKEVLLKTVSCGICHSDVHIHDGFFSLGGEDKLPIPLREPLTMGHEVFGEIVEKGDETNSVEVGKKYVAFPWIGCGDCDLCKKGDEHYCGPMTSKNLGINTAGGYGEYVLVPDEKYLFDAGDTPDDLAGSYACRGLTAYSALKKANPVKGDNSLIIVSAGGLGLLALKIAKAAYDINPIIVDIDDEKLELAKKAGASEVINSTHEGAFEKLFELTGGGAKYVVDYVGAQASVSFGYNLLRRGGIYVVTGLFGGSMNLQLPMLTIGARSLVGTYVGSYQEMKELMELVKDGKIDPVPVESKPVNEINGILDDLKNGKVPGLVSISHN